MAKVASPTSASTDSVSQKKTTITSGTDVSKLASNQKKTDRRVTKLTQLAESVKEAQSDIDETQKKITKEQDRLSSFIYYIVIFMMLAVAGIFLDYYYFKYGSTHDAINDRYPEINVYVLQPDAVISTTTEIQKFNFAN